MSEILFNRFTPVVTGTPQIRQAPAVLPEEGTERTTFQEVLEEKLKNSALAFSKHATERVARRGVELSDINIARLNEGARIAQSKGLDDTLILVDSTAFLVSVRNQTVITAMGGEDLKGNIFTNIDGTVII